MLIQKANSQISTVVGPSIPSCKPSELLLESFQCFDGFVTPDIVLSMIASSLDYQDCDTRFNVLHYALVEL